MPNWAAAVLIDQDCDETLQAIRDEMRKFADSEVVPQAQAWHRTNSYIPLEILTQMSELGVFGLTIPEEYGGLGLGLYVAREIVLAHGGRGWGSVTSTQPSRGHRNKDGSGAASPAASVSMTLRFSAFLSPKTWILKDAMRMAGPPRCGRRK